MERTLLTTREIANFLRIAPKTISHYRKLGLLSYIKLPIGGGALRSKGNHEVDRGQKDSGAVEKNLILSCWKGRRVIKTKKMEEAMENTQPGTQTLLRKRSPFAVQRELECQAPVQTSVEATRYRPPRHCRLYA